MMNKTISMVAVATMAMLGTAAAQQAKPAPGAGSAGAGAGASAGAKADTKAGTTGVKAGVGVTVDAKAGAGAGATGGKPTDMTPPKPAAEIATMAKMSVGNWKCTGQGMDPSMATVPMKATMKTKVDLDGWWIQDTFDGTMGKAKFKMVAYTTYDAGSKKWRRVSVDNMGGQMIGTSDGVKENKVVFNMDTVGGGMSGQFRDTVDMTDAKNVKAWGERSMDKGKTWTKVYETTCKK